MSIVLEGNGGSFPDGSGKLTLEPINGFVHLPDWSAVDRPGYTLTGWTASDGTSMSMGEKAADGTYTAVWTEDPVRYCTDFLPQCAVRIYRAMDEYIDVTERMSSLPVIEKAENRPGSATFSVVKGVDVRGVIDPAKNPLSPACTLWNKGEAGGVRPGMYVWFGDVGKDGRASYVFDGFITTVTGSDTDAEITVGDRIAFLGKSGTWLRRNYRSASGRRSMKARTATDEEGKMYAIISSVPEDASIDPYADWAQTLDGNNGPFSSYTQIASDTEMSDRLIATCSIGKFADYLREFTVGFRAANYSSSSIYKSSIRIRAELQINRAVYTAESDEVTLNALKTLDSGYSEIFLTFSTRWLDGIPASVYDDITLRVYATVKKSGSGQPVKVAIYSTDGTGTISTSGETLSKVVTYSYKADTLHTTPVSVSGGRLYPSESSADLADWAVVYYTTGTVQTTKIMSDMCEALDIIPIVKSDSSAALNVYRTGGGYAQDYFQRLADIADANGRMLAYSVRGYTVPVMVIGDRFQVGEGSQASIAYGGDDVAGAIFFSSFEPKMTMKNRPNLVTLRGTMSERSSQNTKTITVSVEDPVSTDDRFGIIVEQVLADTNINSIVDGVQSAYSELSSSELDEWEGSITLPEVRADFINVYGSGVPVTIHDSRNGISDYPTLVRQQRTDYNACETILTVGNYSERYSNAIADGVDMAISAVDASTQSSETTLFNAQYVRVTARFSGDLPSTGNVVKIKLEGWDTDFQADNVKIFAMPRGGYIVVATIAGTSDYQSKLDYGVSAIKLNDGEYVDIDPARRPDLFSGQTLTVSMVLKQI